MSPDDQDQAQAITRLRAILKPGDTLHGIQRHRSRSGKSRSLSLVAPIAGELVDLDAPAACALSLSLDRKHGGIRTDLCGRDVVSNLSRVLFSDGDALTFRRL